MLWFFALGGQAVVEDLVEAVGFGLVAVYRVGDFFGSVCWWGRLVFLSFHGCLVLGFGFLLVGSFCCNFWYTYI